MAMFKESKATQGQSHPKVGVGLPLTRPAYAGLPVAGGSNG